MKEQLCACGRPVKAGHSGSMHAGNTKCLICQTAALMKGWRYPASQICQRKWREKKARAS